MESTNLSLASIIFFAAICCSITIANFNIVFFQLQKKKWNVTEGVIKIAHKIRIIETSQEIHQYFEPQIEYEYFVKGIAYINSKIFDVDNGFELSKKTDELLKKYHQNTNVIVYYDPDNPEDSFLEYSSIIFAKISTICGTMLLITSLLTLLYKHL